MKFCIICNLHFGVSGGFFQGAKLRTLVYVIEILEKKIVGNRKMNTNNLNILLRTKIYKN